MPTLSLDRDVLFERLGRTYTDKEFDAQCFDFGVELDDITSEAEEQKKNTGKVDATTSTRIIYKIDIPANRYDLLCMEGFVRALRIFLEVDPNPVYRVTPGATTHVMHVKPETADVRAHVVCCVLRDLSFTKESFASFVDLQDKLHQNICRRRTLVAIGTHDLDTIEGPFSYEAKKPTDIKFVPLKQTTEFVADKLLEHYESDTHLKAYVPIIKDKPRYPVIYDKKGRVLSLPPIINSSHSKITLETKNVFIECTATDITKARVVLDTMMAMFSEYCAKPFTCEPVTIKYPDGRTDVTPTLTTRTETTTITNINKRLGTKITADSAASLLSRMMLKATVADDKETLVVQVPCTRSDILHPIDIVEDVGVAYGFNNIEATLPKTITVGKYQPISRLCDNLRQELAMLGHTEVLTLTLCAWAENYEFLRVKRNAAEAVEVANPQTREFEIVRTRLLPGLLKTLACNRGHALPLHIFEVGDVVVQDKTVDVGARNIKRVCAVHMGTTPNFERLHGVIDRVMSFLGVSHVATGSKAGYYLESTDDATYLPGTGSRIVFKGKEVGTVGVVHPQCLKSFELSNVCSAMEMDVECFV